MKMKNTVLCVALMTVFAAHASVTPNQIGTRYLGAIDSDGNSMSRVSVDGWVHNRTPESDRDDTRWNSYYESSDLSTTITHRHTIPQVITDGSAKTGAYIEYSKPVDITNGVLRMRVRSTDWKNIKEFSLILASDGTKFERTLTADMTQVVVNPVNDTWIDIVLHVSALEQYNNPDVKNITAVLWKSRARGDQTITTVIDNFVVERQDGTLINELSTVIPRPEMIRERQRQDWGISVNKTQYTTDIGTAYSGQGITALANYHNGGFSLVGELGIGQLDNAPNKNFLIGDMTATYKINRNVSIYAGLYGDAIASDAGLAMAATFTGVSVGAEVSKENLGGISGGVYQQTYSNNNIQQGFVAKVYAETPITGVNVYVSTKQYTNSMPYNGLFYSPESYARYNIGVGYRLALTDEWTLSGHVDVGQALADGAWSDVNSYRVALDKTLVKNMTAGVAIGSDINPSNNYRYNYVMGTFRWTF
jgi:hypothetical protein